MGHIKTLVAVALLALAPTASVSGCDRSKPSPPVAAVSYITMAMQSPEGRSWGLSSFPKTVGADKCVIHGGGPPLGILVHGVCSTTIFDLGEDEATVRFVQRWNAGSFHADSGRRRHLSHTWEVTVSSRPPGFHIVGSRDYGDFPPQFVRRPPFGSNPNLAPPRTGGGDTHPPLAI
jgi:hypothetical protein